VGNLREGSSKMRSVLFGPEALVRAEEPYEVGWDFCFVETESAESLFCMIYKALER
jgi:hypothetical protein